MSTSILQAEGFGIAFGDRVILAELDFEMPDQGVTVLMGPSGTGKSTLLRALGGLLQASPRYRDWGRVTYLGELLTDHHHPALVVQNPRLLGTRVFDTLADRLRQLGESLSPQALKERIHGLLAEWDCDDLQPVLDRPTLQLSAVQQRRVAMLAELLRPPRLLLLDEPTAHLGPDDAAQVLALVHRVAERLPVLAVMHHQQQARSVAQRVLLLAGGRIQADVDVCRFFDNPPNEVAAQFVRTGSCNVASPDAPAHTLSEEVAPPPPLPLSALMAVESVSEYRGPRGFRWIVPGKIGTSPLPGAVIDIQHDLAALRTVGVTMLITLTRGDLPQDSLAAHGLKNLHLPIYDREAPSINQLRMLAVRITRLIQSGEVLAVHCRAGLGRTGTVVAGWLIHEGLTADAALSRIRAIDKDYVQTEDQEAFLHKLEASFLMRV